MNAGPGPDRVRLLLDQMHYTHVEGGWFPPTRRTLAGLTAAQACHRASGAAMTHTIWELVGTSPSGRRPAPGRSGGYRATPGG